METATHPINAPLSITHHVLDAMGSIARRTRAALYIKGQNKINPSNSLKKITFVEAKKKISYAEATKKEAQSNDQPNGSKIHDIKQNIPSTNHPEVLEIPDIPIPIVIRKVDKTKEVEKKHTEPDPEPAQNINELIAFLVFLINNLEENNTKSNIIKLVVEAAIKCFGFKAKA